MTPANSVPPGAVDSAALGLIPAPRTVTAAAAGPYPLGYATPLTAAPGTEGVARWLRTTLGPATGLPLPAGDGTGTGAGDGSGSTGQGIVLELDESLAPEGYRLAVEANAVRITGGTAAGVFRGAQTLRQLLGPDAFRRAPSPRAAPGRSRRSSSRTNPASAGAA